MSSDYSAKTADLNTPLPRHSAIIMDGNGRWAKQRNLPRIAGHRAGVKALHNLVELCANKNIEALTVYAFSSENWQRPKQEVTLLMELFMSSLKKEIKDLHANNIKLSFIGDKSAFPEKLQNYISESEALTENNPGLHFNIAANYGGRWDISYAAKQIAERVQSGTMELDDIDETSIQDFIQLTELPEPDLFIRTGGEKRISNYLLWQLAYTELYFCDCLWPEFDKNELDQALGWFQGRERRYGRISEQLEDAGDA